MQQQQQHEQPATEAPLIILSFPLRRTHVRPSFRGKQYSLLSVLYCCLTAAREPRDNYVKQRHLIKLQRGMKFRHSLTFFVASDFIHCGILSIAAKPAVA